MSFKEIYERVTETDTFEYALASDPRWSAGFLRDLLRIRSLPETTDCPKEER